MDAEIKFPDWVAEAGHLQLPHQEYLFVGSDWNDTRGGGVWMNISTLKSDGQLQHEHTCVFKSSAQAREAAKLLEQKANEVDFEGGSPVVELSSSERAANLFKALWLESERDLKKIVAKLAECRGSMKEMIATDGHQLAWDTIGDILEEITGEEFE